MTLWLLIVLPHAIVGYAPTAEACQERAAIIARAVSEVNGKRVEVMCKPVESVEGVD